VSTALDNLRPVGAPGRIGQATAIEQSRAIAQVQAMVIVAQQCPRSVPAAIRSMEEACRQPELAGKAFFRFPRAGQTVSGPSVHLARELARCWGNIEHGVTEMRRDDGAAQSEMQAFAWDLETNTRSAAVFIVPHKRDTREGVRDLTDMRDIYENNANNGARRLREAIFSVLPVWFREQAMTLCDKTLEDGGGRPLAQRIADAVTAFERYGVTPGRIAAKFGHADMGELTAHDVGQLGVIYESLKQGTVTVDEEFPAEQPRVTAADIIGHAPEAAQAPVPPRATTGQVGVIRRHFKRLGFTDDEDEQRLAATAAIAGRDAAIESTKELTQAEAKAVADQLAECKDRQQLIALLASGEKPASDA
jgi:hypothetical protein